MLKIYRWQGTTWQFEEGSQPDGAEEVPAKKVPVAAAEKTVTPKNKIRSAAAATKTRKEAAK